MNQDIIFDVIGNTSPFSLMGESSGYMITVNDRSYLLDCGSPIFPSLGYKGIAEINGIFATHSHEDHKRWFTDIVLFTFYNPLFKHKVKLISSEPVLEEFAKNSKAALERSLSPDSKRIIDIPYEEMVEEVTIGPKSKYFIDLVGSGNGNFRYVIKDRHGQTVGPERAKIFINQAANRPRLLYKDDESGEWVEPSSYYSFSSPVFYEGNPNIYHDEACGLTVKAIKATVWHGVPTVAFKFMTERNSLLFSADTVYKPSLWKELYETRRPQKFGKISREEFESGSVIYGDINDFIERTWSRERFEVAMSAYEGSVIIHDVARKNSIVHTDYPDIRDASIDDLFFTHNPDNLTAMRPILTSGKKLLLRDGEVFESVKGNLYAFDADVYIHHFSCDLVGYTSREGAFKVIEDDDLLGTVEAANPREGLMRVELYQDIGGEYYPVLTDPNKYYCLRQDGKVEEVTIYKDASKGRVVENNIRRIVKQKNP
jgi:ribonuclease BN (tRNA processing enzyme)